MTSALGANINEYAYLGLSRKTNPLLFMVIPLDTAFLVKMVGLVHSRIGGAPIIPLLIERPELLDDPLFTKPSARMAKPEDSMR